MLPMSCRRLLPSGEVIAVPAWPAMGTFLMPTPSGSQRYSPRSATPTFLDRFVGQEVNIFGARSCEEHDNCLGGGFLPEPLARPYLDSGRLVRLSPSVIDAGLGDDIADTVEAKPRRRTALARVLKRPDGVPRVCEEV